MEDLELVWKIEAFIKENFPKIYADGDLLCELIGAIQATIADAEEELEKTT